MGRPVAAALAAAVLAGATPSTVLARQSVRGQTKAQAEVHLLGIVTRSWRYSRIPGLVNKRTHALAMNTQAVCTSKGTRLPGNRYRRFECIVRPALHRRHEGLYVSYRVLATGGARVHWLAYRSR